MQGLEMLSPEWRDYELIDSGEGEKLERWGDFVTVRPEPQAIWHKTLSEAEWGRMATAVFRRDARSEERGVEVYKFLTSINPYVQFLPVVEYVRMRPGERPLIVSPDEEDAVPAPWSVSSKGYGKFMCDVFDEWVKYDVGRNFVQLFDVILGNWCGVPPSLCAFAEVCGDGLVVEHNGDVYSCDHFVYPEYRLGNIATDELAAMYSSREQQSFGRDKRDALPMECKRCNYYFLCHGECPKHRFEYAKNGEPYMNVLCEGYKMFFRHTDPYMRYMKTLIEKGEPASKVMLWKK
jgi:uncharacterized protein